MHAGELKFPAITKTCDQRATTINTTIREKDWEWDLDGGKRTVYDGGGRNVVGGGTYRMDGAVMEEPRSQGMASANNSAEDLFSGPNGEVCRRTANGWQTWGDRGWEPVNPAHLAYLERQWEARRSGYSNYDRR